MSGMTTAGQGALDATKPAARALKAADTGISGWLGGLVTGAGSSPSHIIVTGILGVVPGLGQAMDVRDLILGVINVTNAPSETAGWVDLVISLVGCVPLVGDALKVGFKLMKQGKNFGRVLEGVSPKLRGNIEKFMRNINWANLASECKQIFAKVIGAFISGLDTWIARVMTSKAEVKLITDQLRGILKKGGEMIDKAFVELKQMHTTMMGHDLPLSTAGVSPAVPRVTGSGMPPVATPKAAAGGKGGGGKPGGADKDGQLNAKKNKDADNNQVPPNTPKKDAKKAANERRKQKRAVLAEHLTDYHVRNKHRFPKIIHHGRLHEHNDSPGRGGIDHLWFEAAVPERQYIVCDTKSSFLEATTLMAALPQDLRDKFAAFRAEEAAEPMNKGKKNEYPSTPINAKRDAHEDTNVDVHSDNENAVKGGMNPAGKNKDTKEPTGLPAQMTHDWIFYVLRKEKTLIDQGRLLRVLIRQQRASLTTKNVLPYPYRRWVSLVTGRQMEKHRPKNGHHHAIQFMLKLPESILKG